MSTTDGTIKINIWINPERLDALEKAGMGECAEDAFAGMKRLSIYTTEEQKNLLLQRFAGAKYDSATTHSIELLPKQATDKLMELSIRLHSTGPEVTDRFLHKLQHTGAQQ
jgi:hypothetical protein